MKICLIELMPFPYTIGGGTTHLINLGKALSNLGNEVHIISSRPADDYKKVKNIPKELKIHNVGIKHKKFGGGISYYFYRIFFEASFVLSARKKINEIKPDAIDCQSAITTALPAALSKYPFVITAHGIHSEGFEKLYMAKGKKFAAKFLNKIYHLISRFNAKRAKKIISQGRETLDFYTKLADGDDSKGVIIPNLVDIDYWKFTKNKDKKLIVTAARFTKQKALDKLIVAMKSLNDFKLLLIGGGELEKQLKSIAGKNVRFLGFQPIEVCLKKYEKARFTVLPSEFEGLPYSILESMSCGVIPVVTKVGELNNLIKEGVNGFFLKDNSSESIAEKIRSISSKNLDKISQNARKTIVDGWGLEKIGRRFLEAYEACLA